MPLWLKSLLVTLAVFAAGAGVAAFFMWGGVTALIATLFAACFGIVWSVAYSFLKEGPRGCK